MKIKNLVWIFLFCFAVGLFVMSCEKPTAELEKAEAALLAAREAGAPEYATDQYKSAEEKLEEGKDLMDKNSNK